jgi:hypothetical protein
MFIRLAVSKPGTASVAAIMIAGATSTWAGGNPGSPEPYCATRLVLAIDGNSGTSGETLR